MKKKYRKKKLDSKYTNRLWAKVTKKLSKHNLSNDDLHDLNFYYDLLFYYDEHDNRDHYNKILKDYAEEVGVEDDF